MLWLMINLHVTQNNASAESSSQEEVTGGDVVLMELEKKVAVRAGDAVFFRGECIAHMREAV